MCGIAAILLYPQQRAPVEWQAIAEVFTRNLLFNEERGNAATGLAVVQMDGSVELFKAPLPASEFVLLPEYLRLLALAGSKTTLLLGHTRLPTKGDPARENNNTHRQVLIERQVWQSYLNKIDQIIQSAIDAQDMKSLLYALTDLLTALIDADKCYIVLWDDDRMVIPLIQPEEAPQYYQIHKGESGEPTLVDIVLRVNQPVIISDMNNSVFISSKFIQTHPVGALLELSMIAMGHKIGAAFIAFDTPHVFTEEEVRRVSQAIPIVSLSLAKTWLYEQSHRRAAKLELLEHLSIAMRSATNRASLLPIIVDEVTDLFQVQGVMLILVDQDRRELVVELASKAWSSFTGTRFPQDQGISGHVVQTGMPYSTNHLDEDPYAFSLEYYRLMRCAATASR